jgi:YHS domain-containing protein
MTPARQQRKSQIISSGLVRRLLLAPWRGVWRLALAAVVVLALPGLPRVGAATTERVVSDRFSGLALNGIDPVAYFTDAAPLYGRAEREYRYAGVTWRFRNEGNMAAFIDNPNVYMPRYGGYDPIAVGRAVAVPGNPLLWTVFGERLYLFYSEQARARFVANPDEAILHADNKWPKVVGGLVQ